MDTTIYGEVARNGAVRIKSKSNQNQIKNQIRNKTLSQNPFQTRFQAIYEFVYFGIAIVNVIFSVSKMNSLLQEKSKTNRFAICSTFERCFLAFYSLLVQGRNVDAAQPSVFACQHLTNLLRSLLIRTGSKYENKTFKYWL